MEKHFGTTIVNVATRDEYPLDGAKRVLNDETVAVLGYGNQGPAQAMNLRDNDIHVIVGQREGGEHYDKAIVDGWVPGETLFSSLEEAAQRGTIVQYLLSDAGQMQMWPTIKKCLDEEDALYFSHGFSIVYAKQTGVVPPENVDVILVAPKGTGDSVRKKFKAGSGINSSYAIHQDFTKRAEDRTLALGIAIGSGYLFPTTFEKEVYSDLTGERAALLGGLWGLMEAQYEVFRIHGHDPSEAFNETVEELTQSLIQLIGENGMDHLLAKCSSTARIGALEWGPKFKEVLLPVIHGLYDSVVSGEETRKVLEANSRPDYSTRLDERLARIARSEMWRAGAAVRSLRPENK
jgi:ketol-acid reductoisomerase